MKIKKSFILTIFLVLFFACKTKNNCPSFDNPSKPQEQKEGSKYKLILLKDGKKVFGGGKRNKKADQNLFKKGVLPN